MITIRLKLFVKSALIMILFLVNANANQPAAEGELLPTDVLYLSLKSMTENPTMSRMEQVGPFFSRMKTEDLNDDEKFALGEVYFLNFKPKEAIAAFEPFMNGDGIRARIAWQRAIQIRFRSFKEVERAEEMVGEYRTKFKPNKVDVWGLERQILNLAGKYQQERNYQKAVDLITQELERLPKNTPFMAFRVPGQFIKSFQETGNADLVEKLITEIQKGLKNAEADYVKAHPEGGVYYKAADYVPGRLYRMEEGLRGIISDDSYPTPELRHTQLNLIINELEATLKRLRSEK